MIDARELRIGNIVESAKCGGEVFITTVAHIKPNGFAYDVNNWKIREPVKLNVSILLALGFVIANDLQEYEKGDIVHYCYGDRNKSAFIRICFHPVGRWTVSYRGVSLTKPEYVHQLQNIFFALTNEELTYI